MIGCYRALRTGHACGLCSVALLSGCGIGIDRGTGVGAGVGFANEFHIGFGHGDAFQLAILRLPRGGVIVDEFPDVGRAAVATVGNNSVGLDFPTVAVAGPQTIAETAAGIEEPGVDLAAAGIP